MRTRSIVFDVFGSYVRYKGGAIGIGDLAQILSWFGVTDDAARVTMSRMRREGWFASRRSGRTSYYELSERGWAVLDEGRARIFDRRHDEWSGEWHLVVLPPAELRRAEREALRREMSWRGYAQLAPSTWIAARQRSAGLEAFLPDGAAVQIFTAHAPSAADDEQLATTHWDLDSLAEDYRRFIGCYESLMSASAVEELSDEDAFVRRTEITHEYRKFPFRDPDLPARLLPNAWPGHEAHGVFLHIVDALAEASWSAFDRVYDQPPPTATRALG